MYSHRLFPSRFGVLLLLILGMNVFTGNTVTAQTPPTQALSAEVSPTQVADLIRMLEDESARTAFLARLKVLSHLQAQELAESSGTQTPLSRVMLGIELAAQQLLTTSQNILGWFAHAPRSFAALRAWFTAPETYRVLFRNLQHLAFSLLPALGVFLLLRRLLRPLIHLTPSAQVWPILQQVWRALREVCVHVIPMAGLWIVTVALLQWFNTAPALQETVRFLLAVLLMYQVLAWSVWTVLAPERIVDRLVPVGDETANYLWVWARRFLRYGVVYALIMYVLQWLYTEPQAYEGVRTLLLSVFPLLVTVFVAQVARYRTHRPGEALAAADAQVLQTTRRVLRLIWPFLAVFYAWALTIFIISQHKGGVSFLVWASAKTLLATIALFLVLRVFNRLFDYAFRLGDQLRQRYPLLEQRTNRYLHVLREICNGLLVLLVVSMVLAFWGVPVSWLLTSPFGRQILARTTVIALAAGFTSVALGLSKTIADMLLQTRIDAQGVVQEPSRQRKTLVPLSHAVLKVAIVFVAVLIVLEQLNINTGPILAGVGILGLAIGFGAQSLVKDVINGLFVLFEDSLSVGDVATLRGTGGLVEKVTLRAVTLRDLAGNVHVIPNGSIDMVTNMTKEFSRYVLDVGVAYRENVDEVIGILQEVDEDMRADPAFGKDMLQPIEILGLDRFADSALIIRARLITKPIQQWRIGREFNRRMKKVFDERGIEIPFPHRTLYWGTPKEGPQQPVHVSVGERNTVLDKA